MKIYINDILLLNRIKNKKQQYEYFLESNIILKTSDINYFTVYCNDCNKRVDLLNYPTTKNNNYLCHTCKQIGEKNPMYGKKWTEEQKEIRCKMYIGQKNPMFNKTTYDVWVEKYGKDIADKKQISFKEKMSNVTKGDKNAMYGKTFYDIWVNKYGKDIADNKLLIIKEKHRQWLKDNKEHHIKMIYESLSKPYHKTAIEKEVEFFLNENNINYKYNLIDKYQYDFLLIDYNIIIEVQGDYWHSNPLYYSETDTNLKKLNETQKYKLNLDKLKHDYIIHKYEIVYLWETDIKNKNYKKILWNLLK